ncbi:MAG TPA: aryl-sulfate sulfotransferase [Terriglobia bacterium]|nr:aryl-sulfate sulfotransferase [Terriglobia bacterium]
MSLATRHAPLYLVAILAFVLLSFGCGSNTSTVSSSTGTPQASPLAANIQVQVTPLVAGVLIGQTAQFSAAVTGTSNTAVKWSVNGVAGGNASMGTISATGLYTAPAKAPGSSVTITAASQENSAAAASASVAVMAPGVVSATQNPQVAQYSLTVPRYATVSVQFGPTTSYGLTTSSVPTSGGGGGTVNILVAGMRASTTYHMQAIVDFPSGEIYYDVDQTFTTGAPALNLLPQVVATQTGSLTPNPGIELLTLQNLSGSGPLQAAAVDLQGNLIWYYNFANPQLVVEEPIKLLPNGRMLVNLIPNFDLPPPPNPGALNVLQEVDLSGNIIAQLTLNQLNNKLANAGFKLVATEMHHDILPLPNGHTIVLVNSYKSFSNLTGYPGTVNVLGDDLVDLDPNWNPVWVWSTFDHLNVNRHPMNFPDWTHANAVLYSPDDGDLILSMRDQNWIIKIDYDNGQGSGNIVWTLGQGGDFTLTNGTDIDWFYGQHYPVILTPNSSGTFQMAVWDNGNDRIVDSSGDLCGTAGQIPCYSRPVILQIDETAKTATILWQDVLSIFTPWGGSIESLANGDFEFDANAYAGVAATVFEVTQEPTPQPVWQLQINGQYAYRGFRIPSLYPGVQW